MHLKPVHWIGGALALGGLVFLATRKTSAPLAAAPSGTLPAPEPRPRLDPVYYQPPGPAPYPPPAPTPQGVGGRVQAGDTIMFRATDPGAQALGSLLPSGTRSLYASVTAVSPSALQVTVNSYRVPDDLGGAAAIQDMPVTIQKTSVEFIDREGNMPL